jgi:hypothetical protein
MHWKGAGATLCQREDGVHAPSDACFYSLMRKGSFFLMSSPESTAARLLLYASWVTTRACLMLTCLTSRLLMPSRYATRQTLLSRCINSSRQERHGVDSAFSLHQWQQTHCLTLWPFLP